MSSNKPVVPNAKQALDNMKYEIAKENGINFKQGYNGDLTAAENGKIGGQMVKKMIDQYKNG
ncbi:MAG: alpha/beta-type small acid-soluble spore protein [Clostridiales bacterium]|nr:alpha/beta-type small acid-soluble spore protein [Clostridiales bacterium]MBP3940437.1 alpha/beta-type small acid-soluble spore protein [Christensenellaceae bacterium]